MTNNFTQVLKFQLGIDVNDAKSKTENKDSSGQPILSSFDKKKLRRVGRDGSFSFFLKRSFFYENDDEKNRFLIETVFKKMSFSKRSFSKRIFI